MGQIDSAESGVDECPDSAARAWAAWVGEAGVEVPERPGEPAALCCSSRRRRLMASACRFGGPRRLLGRSNVHGMSSAAQALHGGPVSSHCSRQRCCSGHSFIERPTFTLRMLHESHALRRRFVFCGWSGVEVWVAGWELAPALAG